YQVLNLIGQGVTWNVQNGFDNVSGTKPTKIFSPDGFFATTYVANKDQITFKGSLGTDTYNVQSEANLLLDGKEGNDVYNIRYVPGTSAITVRDSGVGDTNSVFVNDASAVGLLYNQYYLSNTGVRRDVIPPSGGTTYELTLTLHNVANLTINATSLTWNAFTIDDTPVTSSVTINGGAVRNLFNVNRTRAGTTTFLNAGTGENVVNFVESLASIVQGALAGSVYVAGAGNTTVHWDDRQVTPAISGAVTYLLGPSTYSFGDGSLQR